MYLILQRLPLFKGAVSSLVSIITLCFALIDLGTLTNQLPAGFHPTWIVVYGGALFVPFGIIIALGYGFQVRREIASARNKFTENILAHLGIVLAFIAAVTLSLSIFTFIRNFWHLF